MWLASRRGPRVRSRSRCRSGFSLRRRCGRSTASSVGCASAAGSKAKMSGSRPAGRKAMITAIRRWPPSWSHCASMTRMPSRRGRDRQAGDGWRDSPTPAMKRFVDSVARRKGIRPRSGYTKSRSVCRAFLDQHAPKNANGESPGEPGSKPVSPAQMLFAEKIARAKGIVISDETKASSAAMSAWIGSQLSTERAKSRRKTAEKPARPTAPKSPASTKRSRMHKADAIVALPTSARSECGRGARHPPSAPINGGLPRRARRQAARPS